MSKKLHTEPIYSLTEVSPEMKVMLREAIRGEFEGGKYVRDMGTSALSGAVGGAIAGGGIGSLPGAAVGALSGAAFGLGSNAVADISYQMSGNEGKAAWQAADVQERLEKMSGLLAEKTKSSEFAQLSELGRQYKNFIDVTVNKASGEDQKKVYQQSIFNQASEAHKMFRATLQPKQAQAKQRFTKVAYETSTQGVAGGLGAAIITDKLLYTYFTNPSSLSPEITQAIQQQLQTNPSVQSMLSEMKAAQAQGGKWMAQDVIPQEYKDWHNQYLKKYPGQDPGKVINQFDADAIAKSQQEYAQIATQRAEQEALKQGKSLLQPKNLLNTALKGVAGLGAGLVVDFASNWALDKIDMAMTGGEINMFRKELDEVGKIITEINRLTSNAESVVYAGNVLWTNLKKVDRLLGEVGEKKTQEQQQQVPVNQQQQQEPQPDLEPKIASDQDVKKFKRVG